MPISKTAAARGAKVSAARRTAAAQERAAALTRDPEAAPGQCRIQDCDNPTRARGLCSSHHEISRRGGRLEELGLAPGWPGGRPAKLASPPERVRDLAALLSEMTSERDDARKKLAEVTAELGTARSRAVIAEARLSDLADDPALAEILALRSERDAARAELSERESALWVALGEPSGGPWPDLVRLAAATWSGLLGARQALAAATAADPPAEDRVLRLLLGAVAGETTEEAARALVVREAEARGWRRGALETSEGVEASR
jgi:hypothetical protein